MDNETLARASTDMRTLIDAEQCLKSAFSTDVRPMIEKWRRARGLAADPLLAFRASGYLEAVTSERAGKSVAVSGYC